MKISGVMMVQNDPLYIEISIRSIIDYLDELIIIDNNSSDNTHDVIASISNDKIKLTVTPELTRVECIQLAVANCSNEWILRCDADMIYSHPPKFAELIDKYDGIFFCAVNLFGDQYHVEKSKPYKLYNLFLIRKSLITFKSSKDFSLIYSYDKGKDKGKYLYYNDPNKHECFIWHMSYCKLPSQLLFSQMKNQYQVSLFQGDFKSYVESLGKSYYGTIKWLERNMLSYTIPCAVGCSVNVNIQLPFKIIEWNNVTYYQVDQVYQNDPIHDYEITLTILVRNTQQYLKECLESVFKQTSNRWRIVLVNDFSDLGPIDIIDYVDPAYAYLIDRITVVNLDQWHGLPRAHSVAINHVRTDIVGVLDSDDTLELNAIQEVLKVYNHSDEEIFVYTNYWFCDANLTRVELGYSTQCRTSLLNERCASHFRTFMMKTYRSIDGYDEELVLGAVDQDLFFQLEMHAKPVYLPQYLYYYRFVNMTGTITSMNRANSYMLYISIFKNICRKYGFNKFHLKIFSSADITTYRGTKSYQTYGDSKAYLFTGNKYYFEIYSHDIFIDTLRQYDAACDLAMKYSHGITDIDINIKWDNNAWTLDDMPMDDFMTTHRKITINQYFSCVYVLNLSKDTMKRRRMERILTNLQIKHVIFDATYGRDHIDDFNRVCNVANYKSPGAYGYTLTMIDILNDAKKNKYKKILTLDDDVIFSNDFVSKFDQYIRGIPHDWYLLFLGLSGPWTHPWINGDFKNYNFGKYHINDLTNCDGSYAVGYDHRVFDELLDVITKFEYPFDTAIIKHFNMYHQRKCFAFYPFLVIADTTSSDISDRSDDIEENFLQYQFKFRINLNNYDLKSLDHDKYSKLKIII
jgi:glycosyltransferase involved in cell wall biosynthesis